MADSSEHDFIGDSLELAPEPYRSIIKRRLDDGDFGEFLEGVQQRYGLNEEQINAVTLLTFRTACDPDLIDQLKDGLISEADVSYEQAVKIQRDITRDVILPIKEEGDRLVPQHDTPRSGGSPAQSEPLFSDGKAEVTLRTLRIGGATYPVGVLSRLVGPFFVSSFGFIGDIMRWGDWYVAVHFVDGEERMVFWKDEADAKRFAVALRSVMS